MTESAAALEKSADSENWPGIAVLCDTLDAAFKEAGGAIETHRRELAP